MGNELLFLGLFASSWMLLWAAAAAIPIVLHLLSRRQRRSIRWAAVQFVIAAQQKSQRKFRLWQWLLLALRVLAIVLFAIALADPVIDASADVPLDRRPRLQILVIDGSMSMKARRDDGTRWSDAIAAASQRCDDALPGDGFLLLQVGAQNDWIVDTITYDPVEMQQTLASLQPTDSEAAFDQTLESLSDRIRSIDRDALWNGEVHVVIFSDMQATSWQRVSSQTKLTSDALWEIVEVGNEEVENSHIETFHVDAGFFVAKQPLQLHSRIARSSRADTAPMLVQLLVDGVVQESRRVAIAAGSRGEVHWQLPLSQGEHVVAVQIPEDDLNADNVRRMVVDMRPALRVACVGSEASATRFAATALRSGTAGSLQVEEIVAPRLDRLDPNAFDCIVLCDLGPIGAADAQWLRRYLQQGHTAMLWLGPRSDPNLFNREFANSDSSDPLAIGRIESLADAGQYPIDPRGYAHPITQPFQSHPDSGLITTPVFRYWKILPVENSRVETVLGVGDGDPLFLSKRLASGGRLIVIATAVNPQAGTGDASWNAIALWPSFIPLMQETVALTRDPNPNAETAVRSTEREAGVYPVRRDGKVIGQFAVNPPVAESELVTLDRDRLPQRLRPESDEAATVAQTDEVRDAGVPLFQIVLACLIGCLVAESAVSRQLR
ncbi:hypothetical protein Poly24_55290 [Rosistilla carotiformis]|uniref:Uncharacterized protein n=1 Tax=Rosistilla carotiformis TaxID=2528017 RepID=A0A518K1Z4_9BACT|nr:BatA domain-containing protein [Rosistilla carotiformis]QDV71789.1 hypothetical protein Poly24_55290 [Rosistilla carotiformis]